MEAHSNLEKKLKADLPFDKVTAMTGAMLIVLFVYAALVKLLDFDRFRAQMIVQPFGPVAAHFLSFFLPVAELSATVLLMFPKTRVAGFWLSAVLLLEFTGYAALALFHFWNRTPCPCGGFIGRLSWPWHLVSNAVFLSIAITGLYSSYKERRVAC